MTREEAIEVIKQDIPCEHDTDLIEALEMAIQALSQEPTITSTDEPMTMVYPTIVCDDAISREELLKAIDTWDKFGCDADTKLVRYQDHYVPYIHYDDVIKCIKGMPSVTQKSGKWIWSDEIDRYVCDKCGQSDGKDKEMVESGEYPLSNYCHNCGCRMVEPQESEVRNEVN